MVLLRSLEGSSQMVALTTPLLLDPCLTRTIRREAVGSVCCVQRSTPKPLNLRGRVRLATDGPDPPARLQNLYSAVQGRSLRAGAAARLNRAPGGWVRDRVCATAGTAPPTSPSGIRVSGPSPSSLFSLGVGVPVGVPPKSTCVCSTEMKGAGLSRWTSSHHRFRSSRSRSVVMHGTRTTPSLPSPRVKKLAHPSKSRLRHSRGSSERRQGSNPRGHALPKVSRHEGRSLHDPRPWHLEARA